MKIKSNQIVWFLLAMLILSSKVAFATEPSPTNDPCARAYENKTANTCVNNDGDVKCSNGRGCAWSDSMGCHCAGTMGPNPALGEMAVLTTDIGEEEPNSKNLTI